MNRLLRLARAFPTPPGMRFTRYLLVHGLLVIILSGTMYSILQLKEHWPFLFYHMYSHISPPHFTRTVSVGFMSDCEILLQNPKYILPLTDAWLSSAVAKVAGQERSEEKFREVARAIFEVYERRRLAGLHDGPKLEGLRIYRAVWVLQPGLENRALPDSSQLLTEYSPSQ